MTNEQRDKAQAAKEARSTQEYKLRLEIAVEMGCLIEIVNSVTIDHGDQPMIDFKISEVPFWAKLSNNGQHIRKNSIRKNTY